MYNFIIYVCKWNVQSFHWCKPGQFLDKIYSGSMNGGTIPYIHHSYWRQTARLRWKIKRDPQCPFIPCLWIWWPWSLVWYDLIADEWLTGGLSDARSGPRRDNSMISLLATEISILPRPWVNTTKHWVYDELNNNNKTNNNNNLLPQRLSFYQNAVHSAFIL